MSLPPRPPQLRPGGAAAAAASAVAAAGAAAGRPLSAAEAAAAAAVAAAAAELPMPPLEAPPFAAPGSAAAAALQDAGIVPPRRRAPGRVLQDEKAVEVKVPPPGDAPLVGVRRGAPQRAPADDDDVPPDERVEVASRNRSKKPRQGEAAVVPPVSLLDANIAAFVSARNRGNIDDVAELWQTLKGILDGPPPLPLNHPRRPRILSLLGQLDAAEVERAFRAVADLRNDPARALDLGVARAYVVGLLEALPAGNPLRGRITDWLVRDGQAVPVADAPALRARVAEYAAEEKDLRDELAASREVFRRQAATIEELEGRVRRLGAELDARVARIRELERAYEGAVAGMSGDRRDAIEVLNRQHVARLAEVGARHEQAMSAVVAARREAEAKRDEAMARVQALNSENRALLAEKKDFADGQRAADVAIQRAAEDRAARNAQREANAALRARSQTVAEANARLTRRIAELEAAAGAEAKDDERVRDVLQAQALGAARTERDQLRARVAELEAAARAEVQVAERGRDVAYARDLAEARMARDRLRDRATEVKREHDAAIAALRGELDGARAEVAAAFPRLLAALNGRRTNPAPANLLRAPSLNALIEALEAWALIPLPDLQRLRDMQRDYNAALVAGGAPAAGPRRGPPGAPDDPPPRGVAGIAMDLGDEGDPQGPPGPPGPGPGPLAGIVAGHAAALALLDALIVTMTREARFAVITRGTPAADADAIFMRHFAWVQALDGMREALSARARDFARGVIQGLQAEEPAEVVVGPDQVRFRRDALGFEEAWRRSLVAGRAPAPRAPAPRDDLPLGIKEGIVAALFEVRLGVHMERRLIEAEDGDVPRPVQPETLPGLPAFGPLAPTLAGRAFPRVMRLLSPGFLGDALTAVLQSPTFAEAARRGLADPTEDDVRASALTFVPPPAPVANLAQAATRVMGALNHYNARARRDAFEVKVTNTANVTAATLVGFLNTTDENRRTIRETGLRTLGPILNDPERVRLVTPVMAAMRACTQPSVVLGPAQVPAFDALLSLVQGRADGLNEVAAAELNLLFPAAPAGNEEIRTDLRVLPPEPPGAPPLARLLRGRLQYVRSATSLLWRHVVALRTIVLGPRPPPLIVHPARVAAEGDVTLLAADLARFGSPDAFWGEVYPRVVGHADLVLNDPAEAATIAVAANRGTPLPRLVDPEEKVGRAAHEGIREVSLVAIRKGSEAWRLSLLAEADPGADASAQSRNGLINVILEFAKLVAGAAALPLRAVFNVAQLNHDSDVLLGIDLAGISDGPVAVSAPVAAASASASAALDRTRLSSDESKAIARVLQENRFPQGAAEAAARLFLATTGGSWVTRLRRARVYADFDAHFGVMLSPPVKVAILGVHQLLQRSTATQRTFGRVPLLELMRSPSFAPTFARLVAFQVSRQNDANPSRFPRQNHQVRGALDDEAALQASLLSYRLSERGEERARGASDEIEGLGRPYEAATDWLRWEGKRKMG